MSLPESQPCAHSSMSRDDHDCAMLLSRSSTASSEADIQATKSTIVDSDREVYTITDESLPSHMRSLLPSHEQHVHDLLTLERTRKRLRYVIIGLTVMLALTVLVAVTLVFSLKITPGAGMRESSHFKASSASSYEQVSEMESKVKISLLKLNGDASNGKHKWTVYKHSAVQHGRTPCVTECWSYAAFRFRSVCEDGNCRCKGENYDPDTCLPKYESCHIKKLGPTKALAKLSGKNQTTYFCHSPSSEAAENVHVVSIFGNHRAATTLVTIKNQLPSSNILVLVNYHFLKWTVHLEQQSTISKVYVISMKRRSQADRVVFKGSWEQPEVEVVRKLSLTGYGEDKYGGHTPQLLRFIETEVGPVTSFLGASHADQIFLDFNDNNDTVRSSTTWTSATTTSTIESETYQ